MTRLLAIAAIATSAWAGCLPPRGDRITASDLAQAVPAFSGLPADQVIGYAPVPGVTRTFRAQELRQWLMRHGAGDVIPEDVCFEWPLRTPTAEEIRTAMLSSLPQGSDVVVNGLPALQLPAGVLQFPRSGISTGSVWAGSIEYAPRKRLPISVRVTLKVPYSRVVATSPMRAGDRITADRLRLETGTGAPAKEGTATAIEEIAGKTAVRFIPAGTAIELKAVTEPDAVSRGDALQVEVRSGMARLRFEGLAQASAARGTLVPVRIRDTGRIVHARVAGEGQAVLDLEKP